MGLFAEESSVLQISTFPWCPFHTQALKHQTYIWKSNKQTNKVVFILLFSCPANSSIGELTQWLSLSKADYWLRPCRFLVILWYKTEKCDMFIAGLELTIFKPDDTQCDKQNPWTKGYFKARYNDATVVSRICKVSRIRDGPDAAHIPSLPLGPALPPQPVLRPPPRRASSTLLHIQRPRLSLSDLFLWFTKPTPSLYIGSSQKCTIPWDEWKIQFWSEGLLLLSQSSNVFLS